MNLRRVTISLIFIYGASILSFSVLEAGHSILHIYKNSIHHHDHSYHHVASDHHIINSSENPDASDTDSISPTHCYLLFFEANVKLLNGFNLEGQQFFDFERRLLSAIGLLLVPPPRS